MMSFRILGLIKTEVEYGLLTDKPIKWLVNAAVCVLNISDSYVTLCCHPHIPSRNVPKIGELIEHLRIEIGVKADANIAAGWVIGKDMLELNIWIFGL